MILFIATTQDQENEWFDKICRKYSYMACGLVTNLLILYTSMDHSGYIRIKLCIETCSLLMWGIYLDRIHQEIE